MTAEVRYALLMVRLIHMAMDTRNAFDPHIFHFLIVNVAVSYGACGTTFPWPLVDNISPVNGCFEVQYAIPPPWPVFPYIPYGFMHLIRGMDIRVHTDEVVHGGSDHMAVRLRRLGTGTRLHWISLDNNLAYGHIVVLRIRV